MKPYVWKSEHTAEEAKNGAYWERNMLVIMYAALANGVARKHHAEQVAEHGLPCGWYRHQPDPWPGWERIVSLEYGRFTFHVPDDFDLGNLPEIEPNWDGHSTEDKWLVAMRKCGCALSSEQIRHLLIGEWSDQRCPRCGAGLLKNRLGNSWCSNPGGAGHSPCKFGLEGWGMIGVEADAARQHP